jgi:uncharacterized protein
MKFVSLALIIACVALTACGQRQTISAPTNSTVAQTSAAPDTPYLPYAQTNMQVIKLYVGAAELRTELALKPVEIFTGMMWRTNMTDEQGMLFVFGSAEPRSFYMRNTKVPLSAAYIDPEGTIVEIHDLKPLDETPVPSNAQNIQYVLEVPQGWFQRKNISTGTVVRTQFGELKKTFSFKPLR